MATVYLCDMNHLASPFDDTPAPPLSWWCAGELAQWGSAVALRDAWAATAPLSSHPSLLSPAEDHRRLTAADRSAYISFGETGEACGSTPDTAAVQPSSLHYRWCPFPSPVIVRNKYFGVTLSLMVGSGAALVGSSTHDITTSLAQASLHGSPAGLPPTCYGGVLVAHVRQDPAELPWHVFARGGACLFRLVMVFLARGEGDEEAEIQEGTQSTLKANAPPALESSSQKERWQYFAIENGYECIFHRPAESPPTNEKAGASLEVVVTASGRRGLLEAPLQGSNRLYQVLCNTLWPAEVRDGPGDSSLSSSSSTIRPTQTTHQQQNAFVVVGNNAAAVERLFAHVAAGDAARTRRQLRFFTKVVLVSVEGTGGVPPTDAPHSSQADTDAKLPGTLSFGPVGAPAPALVLVNKYCAAVTHPRLVQTAYFSHEMQDMLERYWEQHFVRSGAAKSLCADAPAIVLWPPCPPAVSSASGTACAAAPYQESDDGADAWDARSAYPPLEVVLDALRRHGCSEVVVVVPFPSTSSASATNTGRRRHRHTAQAAHPSLTPYELCVCAERNVEVVDLCAAHTQHIPADENAPPVPVLRDEDDVCATRAVDRLAEILHCVQWDRSHPLPSLPAPKAKHTARSVNSCLVMAYGAHAFQEEAWLSDVAHALRSAAPSSDRTGDTMQDADALAVAAPTIAPAFPVTVRNAYFTADVRLCFEGGLRSHYVTTAAARTFPSNWLAAHDGYVLVTSFTLLQEAAAGKSDMAVAAAALASTLTALAHQAAEWMASQPIPGAAACTEDTPLALLYVTDVEATDVALTAQVEECLRRIVQAGGVKDSRDDESGLVGIPLEVLFLGNGAVSDPYAAKEGVQRIQEAFEQQLWPHRHAAGDRTNAVDVPISTAALATVPAAASAERRSGQEKEACAAASGLPAMRWVPPAVGCALPRGYLVDPETLRSVPLASLAAVSAAAENKEDTERVAKPPLLMTHNNEVSAEVLSGGVGTSASQQQQQQQGVAMRCPVSETELMVWMEKMKTHGHRLGEALRKEQAATLALALEALL